MGTRWFRNVAIGILGIAMSAGAAFAHGDRHEGYRFGEHSQHHGWFHRAEYRDGDHRRWERRHERHERHEFRREQRREWRKEKREHRAWRNRRRDWYARRDDRRPQGWDHGRKEGWRGGQLPPGQEKKMGWRDSRGQHTWRRS